MGQDYCPSTLSGTNLYVEVFDVQWKDSESQKLTFFPTPLQLTLLRTNLRSSPLIIKMVVMGPDGPLTETC